MTRALANLGVVASDAAAEPVQQPGLGQGGGAMDGWPVRGPSQVMG